MISIVSRLSTVITQIEGIRHTDLSLEWYWNCPGVGFADQSAVGTVCSADTGVVAETDCSVDSETTVEVWFH
jgi:hypothetical protein